MSDIATYVCVNSDAEVDWKCLQQKKETAVKNKDGTRMIVSYLSKETPKCIVDLKPETTDFLEDNDSLKIQQEWLGRNNFETDAEAGQEP